MATKYHQLDWKKSMLFEYSKEEKEGYESYTNTKGVVSYRKYYNKGITGELLNAGVRDSQIGQQLSLALKDESGDINILQFSLYDQRNNIDNQYSEPLIMTFGNMKKGETYTIFPYNLTAENQKEYDSKTEGREVKPKYYDKRAVSIKQNGERVQSYLTYAEGDEKLSVPRVVWKEDTLSDSGKKKPSAASLEVKNDFLIAELKRSIDGHLAYEANNNNSTSTEEPKQVENKTTAKENTEVDSTDLPF